MLFALLAALPAALPLATTAAPEAGARLAFTQSLLSELRDVGLPAALDWIRKYKVPDFHTDKSSFDITVSDVELSNVDASAAITLVGADSVQLTLSNLKLGISGHVHVREDIWPHPSVSGSLSANGDGSAATVSLSFALDPQRTPSAKLDKCDANIDINDIKFHGLSILDPIIDWVIGFFKGKIRDGVRDMICDTGVADTLVKQMINPFLAGLTYTVPFTFLQPPFDASQLDWHLIAPPRVVADENATTFMATDVLAEVFTRSGQHSNRSIAPMADPTRSDLRMLTVELSEYPLNTALWSFWTQGQLSVTVTPEMLTPATRGLLNTAFFRLLMPKLYNAFPNHNMTLLVRAAPAPIGPCPNVTIRAGKVKLWAHVDLLFQVLPGSGAAPVDAFSLWDPFEGAVELDAVTPQLGPPRLTGKIDSVDLDLHPGVSHYGELVPALIALLFDPLNTVINSVVLPLANAILSVGFPLPSVSATLAGYVLTVNVTNPIIDMTGGDFALVGTNVKVTLAPVGGPRAVARPNSK